MAILNEARWDDNVRQWNASGGPKYSTNIVSVQSGFEQRARNWVNSMGSWNVGDRSVPMRQYQNLLSFFHRMSGRFYGFRVRDWTDFQDDGRGVLGTGVGTGAMSYQMNKIRAVEGVAGAAYQKITRPVGKTFENTLKNTIKIFWNSLEVPQDGGPGTCMVDDATGVVLFIPNSFNVWQISGQTISLTEPHNLMVGDWITFSEFTNILEPNNDIVAQVSAVNSSTSLTVSNANLTSGLGSGQILHTPGATDIIKWTGMYDYPARFDLDSFDNVAEAFIEGGDEFAPKDVWVRLTPIPLVQIRE